MASDAIVVGFNVRPDAQARELAEKEGVDIRLYRVIYDAIDDIKAGAVGACSSRRSASASLGEAEVRADRSASRGSGVIAGSYVAQRHDPAQRAGPPGPRRRRRLRGPDRVAAPVQGRRRARSREGFECGIGLENFQDLKEGDVIEAFEVREVARSHLMPAMLVALRAVRPADPAAARR